MICTHRHIHRPQRVKPVLPSTLCQFILLHLVVTRPLLFSVICSFHQCLTLPLCVLLLFSVPSDSPPALLLSSAGSGRFHFYSLSTAKVSIFIPLTCLPSCPLCLPWTPSGISGTGPVFNPYITHSHQLHHNQYSSLDTSSPSCPVTPLSFVAELLLHHSLCCP